MVTTDNNNNKDKKEFGRDMFTYGEFLMVKEGITKYLMKQGMPQQAAEVMPLRDFVKHLLWKIALANCETPRDYKARQIKPAAPKNKKKENE